MAINEILSEIRQRVGEENFINSCSGRGCRVDMVGVPSDRIVIDVDKAFPSNQGTGKRCDRILVYGNTAKNRLVMVFIELKSGTFKATDVSAQLQESVDMFAGLIPQISETTCIPILFHGKGVSKLQGKDLNRAPVRFRNQKFPIRRSKCGMPRNLANVLSRSGNL